MNREADKGPRSTTSSTKITWTYTWFITTIKTIVECLMCESIWTSRVVGFAAFTFTIRRHSVIKRTNQKMISFNFISPPLIYSLSSTLLQICFVFLFKFKFFMIPRHSCFILCLRFVFTFWCWCSTHYLGKLWCY